MKDNYNSSHAPSGSAKTQATLAKESHMPRAKSFKTYPPMAQRSKAQAKRPQPKHAFMYTKKHTPKHVTPHHNMHTYECMAYAHFRTRFPSRRYVQHFHAKSAYALRHNRFANVRYLYYMRLGHTSNVCYYRILHLNLLPKGYFKTN